MQDPPHLWALNEEKPFFDCWLKDWEHLLEGTFSNRKQEALL